MSYEQAFEALKDGDFRTAVPLLEQAARKTGYTSDVINHAYTLALYHSQQTTPGGGLISYRQLACRKGCGVGDGRHRALFAGLEPDKVGGIGEIFQAWVAESLAQRSMHPSLESLILWGAFCQGIGPRNT